MEQYLVHLTAAILTNGVVANHPDNLPISPDLQNPDMQGAVLEAWQVHKCFHKAIAQAIPDTTWTQVPGKGILGGLLEQLTPLLSGQGPLGALLAPLLQKIIPVNKPVSPLDATTGS